MQECHSYDWSRDIYKNPTWICEIDHSDIKEFSTQARLVQHLSDRKQHPDLPSDEIQTIARRSVIYLKRRKVTCPICCYDIERQPARVSDTHGKEKGSSHHTSNPDNAAGKRSDRKSNTPTVRFADTGNTRDDAQEPDPESRAGKGKDIELNIHAGQATSTEEAKVSLQKRMAREVAGHLQTAIFRILSIFFLPPEPDVGGDNSSHSWSDRLAQQDSSQVAQSVYQDFLVDSDDDDIDPEYQDLLQGQDHDSSTDRQPLLADLIHNDIGGRIQSQGGSMHLANTYNTGEGDVHSNSMCSDAFKRNDTLDLSFKLIFGA